MTPLPATTSVFTTRALSIVTPPLRVAIVRESPLTAFAEPLGKGRGNQWFAPEDDRPAFFAGIETRAWRSVRKVKDGETTDDLFGFLTTTPNAEVAPIHPKAMPVILIEPEDWQAWLTAPWSEARALQRPLPDGALSLIEAPS